MARLRQLVTRFLFSVIVYPCIGSLVSVSVLAVDARAPGLHVRAGAAVAG